MKILIGLLFLTTFFITSCVHHNYTEIKNENLSSAFIINSSATFKGYYYKGSDHDYSYFESRWDITADRYFKIPADKLKINEIYTFAKNKNELRIDLWPSSHEQFAENHFYKLYVVH